MATELGTSALVVRRLTVDDAIALSEAGIIADTERVELADGVLVEMTPEGWPHVRITGNVNRGLARAYRAPGYVIRSNSTLPLDRYTARLPDVYVGHETEVWPRADQTVLIVEVAETSVAHDLGRKAAEYAAWGAPCYWVVDLAGRRVVVHTDPGDGGYRTVRAVASGSVPLPEIDAAMTLQEIFGAS